MTSSGLFLAERSTHGLHADLRASIEAVVRPLIAPHAERIHLIDPPHHQNVGDSAILLGELDFLAREFPEARLGFHDWLTYSPGADRHISAATILLIHGGGNFGDIWPHHHQFRLKIIERFRHRPIVQLGQSIHFDSEEALAQTQRTIAAHPNFTLVARDQRSEAFARDHFDCVVRLAPDMAFGMDPIVRRPAIEDVFCLLRTDKESVLDRRQIEVAIGRGTFTIDDWMTDPPIRVRRIDRAYSAVTRRLPGLFPLVAKRALRARRAYAESRLRVGVELLSRGRTVVTDRLHAHILSTMMDIPNVVLRSYDAKAEAFFQSWTSRSPIARLVTGGEELSAAVSELLPGEAR